MLLCIAIACSTLLCGCAATIQEDALHEALPAIDPYAGILRTQPATLFFRLGDEDMLVQTTEQVAIPSNEQIESAIIQKLIQGPSASSGNLKPVLPPGTRLLNLKQEGNVLYATFSKELLNTMTDELTTSEELTLSRHMGLYAIVNSLTSLDSVPRVQVLVDFGDSGQGTRLPASVFGIGDDSTSSQLLEPLGFTQEVVATPQTLAAYIMEHLQDQQYAAAHSFFAQEDRNGLKTPNAAAFETALNALGSIDDFAVHSYEVAQDGQSATVSLDITLMEKNADEPTRLDDVNLQFLSEDGMFKLEYTSFLQALSRKNHDTATTAQ